MKIPKARTSDRCPRAKKPLPTKRDNAFFAPPGFFARFYTPEIAAEDNRLAAQSAHDHADFIE